MWSFENIRFEKEDPAHQSWYLRPSDIDKDKRRDLLDEPKSYRFKRNLKTLLNVSNLTIHWYLKRTKPKLGAEKQIA